MTLLLTSPTAAAHPQAANNRPKGLRLSAMVVMFAALLLLVAWASVAAVLRLK